MTWLAAMASLGERVAHALSTRGKKNADLDRYLAQRFGKKGTGTGYTHRVIVMGQQPAADVLEAIADFLDVSAEWLLRGQGPIDRSGGAVATYDSLPGWAEGAESELERGRVQAYAIRAAGRSPAFVRPSTVTPDFVFAASMFWLQHAPEDDRIAAMKGEAARIRAEEDAKR